MKYIASWKPTKFIRDNNGKLVSSKDENEVSVGSRLMADLIASWYDANINQYAKGKLLDLGAGKAPLYESYALKVDKVILADWSESLHDNIHLDVICDITKKLPFNDSNFDTIIFSDVLEHVPNPNEVLNEIYRILKPNGVVLMNVPFMYWLHETPHDYYRYTKFMLEKLAKDSGFKVEKLEPLAGGWAVLIDLTSKLMLRRPFIVKIIQKLGPKLLARRLGQRLDLPIAYALVLKKGKK